MYSRSSHLSRPLIKGGVIRHHCQTPYGLSFSALSQLDRIMMFLRLLSFCTCKASAPIKRKSIIDVLIIFYVINNMIFTITYQKIIGK